MYKAVVTVWRWGSGGDGGGVWRRKKEREGLF